MVHLVHVHIVAFREKRVRIVSLAEEPRGSAFANYIGFLERSRKHDKREHRLGEGMQPHNLGPEIGKDFWIGRLKLSGRADLVRRVAGHDLINGGGVMYQAI